MGKSRLPKNMDAKKWVRIALDRQIEPEDILVEKWRLPSGAFGGPGGGPI
jgi:hypothetical protein